ncbi:MAG: hypothetical protein IT366_18935 [Candidatus Hydrogenedentes bacterium]|nr:hypothetical protein [Candidatus Hydrogenedentota bacterium]
MLRNKNIFRPRLGGTIRMLALCAAAFVSVAAMHETLLALEHAAFASDCSKSHGPAAPGHGTHTDHACALCELAGTPILITLAAEPPIPQVSLELGFLASHLTPAVRDESCFPHYRRGPPTLPIV